MNPADPTSKSSPEKALYAAAAVVLIIVAATASAYVILVKVPTDLARNAANGIKETLSFTPRVTISEKVIVEQEKEIIELAVLSRKVSVDYSWSHTWLGSTKTIGLRGTFTAKAGFDLRQPFRVDVQRYPLKVKVQMSPPTLLSLDMSSYEVTKDESGWWNRLTAADREVAVNQLMKYARERAGKSGMMQEAKNSIEQRIREIVEQNGSTVEFRNVE